MITIAEEIYLLIFSKWDHIKLLKRLARDYFKRLSMYIHVLLMFCFVLQVTMQLPATSVATVPLVMFISGFGTSLILERTKFVMGRKISFPIGCLLGIAGCMWIYFGCQYGNCPPGKKCKLYPFDFQIKYSKSMFEQ